MSEEITVEISPDGTVKMEGKNFKGKQCEVLMSEIENALGKVAEVNLKPEYHKVVAHGEKVRGR